jgi:1-acyl-sn-glycerol-3-phosphate acyltransferase
MIKVWAFIRALYIWIVGGGIFLVATLIGIILFNIIPAKKLHYPYSRFLRLVFMLSFIPVERNLNESYDKNKSYIFMANHTSLVDVPLMGAYLPVFANALEAHSHFKWPLYRHLIKAYGQIPINRSSVQKSVRSFELASQKVNQGTSIIVFPEGHRTRDGKLRSFKKLPFTMAKQTHADIIPIGIKGMWEVCGGESFFLYPGKLHMNFGEAISHQQIQEMTEKEISDLVRKRIIQLSE